MTMAELTPREGEVLALAAQGLANDEIATRLAISRRTVEAHMRTLFRKTGVVRRSQLANLIRPMAAPEDTDPAAAETPHSTALRSNQPDSDGEDHTRPQRRLDLYSEVLRRLVDRQFPLFEERVEITVLVGDHDDQDAVVERRWTVPKPYLVYRMLRPIITAGEPAPQEPADLAASCDVRGQDIQVEVHAVWDRPGEPMLVVLFQPGLQTETEWLLRYRSPALWSPLRATGEDKLTWATATVDKRHRPNLNDAVVRVVFPAGWTDVAVTEDSGAGHLSTDQLPTGETQFTWHDTAPMAGSYAWTLRGVPG